MQNLAAALCWRVARVGSLIVLAVVGTTALMLAAPGFFTDAREMDSRYASSANSELAQQHYENGSVILSLKRLVNGWLRGDLGRSRQYDVPVSQLVRERAAETARLISKSLLLGWLIAFTLALPLACRRTANGEGGIALMTCAMLCIPSGVLATVCLIADRGGSIFVLAFLIAIRDFKLLYRLLRSSSKAPRLLYARSQGFSPFQTVRVHLLRSVTAELLAVAMMSFVLALSSAVPVEVIFDRPGLGQLAWGAAMNRDLPVLSAVTIVMAGLVGLASLCIEARASREVPSCA